MVMTVLANRVAARFLLLSFDVFEIFPHWMTTWIQSTGETYATYVYKLKYGSDPLEVFNREHPGLVERLQREVQQESPGLEEDEVTRRVEDLEESVAKKWADNLIKTDSDLKSVVQAYDVLLDHAERESAVYFEPARISFMSQTFDRVKDIVKAGDPQKALAPSERVELKSFLSAVYTYLKIAKADRYDPLSYEDLAGLLAKPSKYVEEKVLERAKKISDENKDFWKFQESGVFNSKYFEKVDKTVLTQILYESDSPEEFLSKVPRILKRVPVRMMNPPKTGPGPHLRGALSSFYNWKYWSGLADQRYLRLKNRHIVTKEDLVDLGFTHSWKKPLDD